MTYPAGASTKKIMPEVTAGLVNSARGVARKMGAPIIAPTVMLLNGSIITDPHTGRTAYVWEGAVGNATHSWMNEAYRPCFGQTKDRCDFIEEHYEMFRGPAVAVFVILCLLAIPAFLTEDMDQAVSDHQMFLCRASRTLTPGCSRRVLLIQAQVIYYLRTYHLPFALTWAVAALLIGSPMSGMVCFALSVPCATSFTLSMCMLACATFVQNMLLNAVAVLFINSLDDARLTH